MEDDEKRLSLLYRTRILDRRNLRLRRKLREDIPTQIAHLLKQFFRSTPDSTLKMSQSQILIAWPRIVGTAIAGVSKAVRIHDGRLFIHVIDPMWRHELSLQKSTLLKRINQEFPQLRLRDIFFSA